MQNWSLIDKVTPTFVAITATAICHCLSAGNTGKLRVPPKCGPGGGAQYMCDTRNINHTVNSACIDEFPLHDTYLRSSVPEAQSKRQIISTAWYAKESTHLLWTQRWRNLTMIRPALMRTSVITSWRSCKCSPRILFIVPAAVLPLLRLACNSQLFCLWVGLPSPATASPSPPATATVTAMISPGSPTWPALKIRY
jgi:hypothetical protein